MNLYGKTVLLTGASKGLGRVLASQLDAKGGRLLLVARDTARLDSLQQTLQTSGSRLFPCDLGDGNGRSRLVEQIFATETRIDLMIHCAGIGSHSKLNQLSPEEIRPLLAVNTIAPLELTAALLPLLPSNQPAGIVTIGSVAGELTLPGMSLYSASKAALHSFSRAAGMELVHQGHFSLLVVLGALRDTQFGESIRHPANKQPGLYRRLDVYPAQAAAQIIKAVEQQRSLLVIPGWQRILLAFNRVLFPLTQPATRHLYRRFR
ncbi:MAG: SDR family NAD(P)-dependent oxidoreductase [Chloroflexi bacterium]|nr:SDR family NAD(P)-dependent oxidoreductase [Chloroflexota bacterium]